MNLIIRRVHLYTTLVCVPWFVMFGVTAFAFNHPKLVESETGDDLYNVRGPNWTEQESWPCTVEVPDEGEVPREVAAELLRVAGIEAGAYGAFRSGQRQISGYVVEFWKTRRVVYDIDREQLTLYVRRPVARSTMTLMHSRAGYRHDSLLNDLWAVMVDATVAGILVWVATGLYMWWQQPRLRVIGGFALVAGVATFGVFVASL